MTMGSMKKLQLAFCGMLALILSGCMLFQETGPVVEPFEFTNQHGEAFGSSQLAGQVWIADFIFTNCETVCPPMTSVMAELQKELEAQGLEAELVSFSVDPAADSPDVLKSYIGKFTPDQSNWNLLTGYSQQEIEEFALEEFQTLVHKPSETDQVLHGINFYVIDPDSMLIDEFSFTDPDLIPRIIEHVERYQP